METLAEYDSQLQNEQADDMEWETFAGDTWQEGETDGLRTFACRSCGGEMDRDIPLP